MHSTTNSSRADWLAIASAILTITAAFLPWATTSGLESFGIITLGLAIVAITITFAFERDPHAPLATTVLGIAVISIAALQLILLTGTTAVNVGAYLTVVGGLGLTVAGLWAAHPAIPDTTPGISS